MTTETEVKKEEKKEVKESIWTEEEKGSMKSKYGNELLVEDGSQSDLATKNAPTDSYIVTYTHEEKVRNDLVRGTKTSLFDMYWDKFKGGLTSIEYGMGGIKPSLWGYKSPQQQKKKRKG